MPADLFDPASRPSPAGSSRRLTVMTSIVLHAAAVIVFVLAPLAGAVSLPAVMTRIDEYVLASAIPVPPMPQPPAPARARTDVAVPNPAAAPITAPTSIEPEIDAPATGAPRITGGVFMTGGSGVPGGLATESGVALAAPPQAPRGPLPIGGDIKRPARVSYVPPVYPAIAQSARIEGTVTLEAIISESGEVTALKVIRSVPLLDEAARAAVARWRYTPTTLNGVKVPVVMTVTVTFTLR
jgi:protein TonB